MKRLFFFTFTGMLLNLSAGSQAIKEVVLPFDYTQCTAFEKDVKWVIDSCYSSLHPNEKLRFILYSRSERNNLPYSTLKQIASQRESLVSYYLRLRETVSQRKIASLLPVDTTAIFNTYCAGDRSPKDNQAVLGIPAVLIVKNGLASKFYPHLDNSAAVRKPYGITIYCDARQEFYTNSGVMIRIEANSFVTAEGRSPSCCEIEFNVEEYLTTSDMLLADLVTHSSGRMLETGGMVYLGARCGNEKLKLAPGKFVYILLPQTEKKKGMLAFNGRKNENTSDWLVQQAGKVYRSPEETDNLFPQVPVMESEEWVSDSEIVYDEGGALADGYLMKSANLGWINCDRFYEIEEKTELMVKAASEENICYRLVFREIRSILPAYSVIPGMLYKFDGLPKGEPATLLGYWVSPDRSKAYFSWKEITTGEKKEETLELKMVSGNELKNLLSELFPV